ncbi:hypothetical protein BGX24_010750 [Mortierella sp. AD032]|nr:hypothetical protein BGX24_010750 [Mortierella sp. AD032]
MTVPLSNVGRYLNHVDKMGSLSKVFVCMDRVFEYKRREDLEGEDQARVATWHACLANKAEAMDKLVQFFREHTRIFPGCIQSVEYYPGDIGEKYFQQCSKQVQDCIAQLLPPIHQPKSLDMGNWSRFLAHPKTTDLSQIEHIETGAPTGTWFGLIRKEREFLQKLPVSEVSIDNLNSATDELDDILYGFSQTLEKLIVYIISDVSFLAHIGHQWHDPAIHFSALAHLSITTRNRLVIDRHLLSRCPNLVSVDISDYNTTSYQCQDIVPCLPARLAKLEDLELLGWTALTFHPDTLYSTASLVSLAVGIPCRRLFNFYIPPDEELNASYGLPAFDDAEDGNEFETGNGTGAGATTMTTTMAIRPSWKWHLPHLTSLELSGEYAYRFQFRMLQGCPALRTMELNMLTRLGLEVRLLTIDGDLFVENSSSSLPPPLDTFSPRPSKATPRPLRRERIMAPKLEILAMRGAWSIDDAVMAKFLGKEMFPRLKKLSTNGWIGFSWSGVARTLRARELSSIPTTPSSSFSVPTSAMKAGTSPTDTATTTAVAMAQQTTDSTLKRVRFENESPASEELRNAGMIDSESFSKRKNEDFLGVMIQLRGLYSVLKVLREADEL